MSLEAWSRAAQGDQQEPPAEERRILSVECGYDLWAERYDVEPNPLLALERRLLAPLLPDVRGKRVLDLACGTGRWLNELLLDGARARIGIDLSRAMIAAARRKPRLRGRLVRADIRVLPLPSACMDLVICSFAVRHFEEIGGFASEVARVASPGATVFISDMHPEAHQRGWRTGFRTGDEAVEIPTYCHALADLQSAFAASGFRLTKCIEGSFEAPERVMFERAWRVELFDQFAGCPAAFVARFGRPKASHGGSDP